MVSSILLLLLITQTRAAYIGLFISGVLFFFRERSISRQLFIQYRELLRPYLWLFIVASVFFVPLVSSRLLYSLNSFGTAGGYTTREKLQEVSLLMLQKNYAWGVGPGMFIPAAFKESPNGIIKYFPESVHNGFLLFATENGLISAALLLLFIIEFVKNVETYFKHSITSLVLAGLLAECCMMLLHPFEDIPSLFIYLVLIVMSIRREELEYAKK